MESEAKARWHRRGIDASKERTEDDQHRSMFLKSQSRDTEGEEVVEEEHVIKTRVGCRKDITIKFLEER
jgi:hypothetical protein